MRTEITKQEADLLGRFEGFDPFVGKLTNGNYSMSLETYYQFEKTEHFQNIDWSTKQWKENSDFDFQKFTI